MRIAATQSEIQELVIASLRSILQERELAMDGPLNESVCLIGQQQVLDSLGLVSLLVDVEQRLEEEYGIALALANDRAMSQKRSPFRTVQTLTEYICLLAEEAS